MVPLGYGFQMAVKVAHKCTLATEKPFNTIIRKNSRDFINNREGTKKKYQKIGQKKALKLEGTKQKKNFKKYNLTLLLEFGLFNNAYRFKKMVSGFTGPLRFFVQTMLLFVFEARVSIKYSISHSGRRPSAYTQVGVPKKAFKRYLTSEKE